MRPDKRSASPMDFAAVDRAMPPWLKRHGLHVYTEYKDEEVPRSVMVVDDQGSTYQIWVDPTEYGTFRTSAAVLQTVPRLPSRKLRPFAFAVETSAEGLPEALENAYALVLSWIRGFGHTRLARRQPPSERSERPKRSEGRRVRSAPRLLSHEPGTTCGCGSWPSAALRNAFIPALGVPLVIAAWMRYYGIFVGDVEISLLGSSSGRQLNPKCFLPIASVVSVVGYAVVTSFALALPRRSSLQVRNAITLLLYLSTSPPCGSSCARSHDGAEHGVSGLLPFVKPLRRRFFLWARAELGGSRRHSYLRPMVGAELSLLARMRDAHGEPIVDSGLFWPAMLSA
jgi:hypothetical protein